MSFTRTNSGLSNLILFYDVDFIVFTEGGCKSYSFNDICEGKFNEQSIDIKFWACVFKKYNLNKKVQFRALGSKNSSEKICKLIESNQVRNIIVARDSDLDHFYDCKYKSPYILYTHGYSWENDVFTPELVKEQIKSFLLTAEMPRDTGEMIDKLYTDFYRHAASLLRLELIFRDQGIGFISECNSDRFIDRESTPKLKMNQIQEIVSHKKVKLSRPIKLNYTDISLNSIRFMYGKLLESIAMAVISYVCKRATTIKSFPKDILRASMMKQYRTCTDHDGDLYYKAQINRLVTA